MPSLGDVPQAATSARARRVENEVEVRIPEMSFAPCAPTFSGARETRAPWIFPRISKNASRAKASPSAAASRRGANYRGARRRAGSRAARRAPVIRPHIESELAKPARNGAFFSLEKARYGFRSNSRQRYVARAARIGRLPSSSTTPIGCGEVGILKANCVQSFAEYRREPASRTIETECFLHTRFVLVSSRSYIADPPNCRYPLITECVP